MKKRWEWMEVGGERSKEVKMGGDKGVFVASKQVLNAKMLAGHLCTGLCQARPQKTMGSGLVVLLA